MPDENILAMLQGQQGAGGPGASPGGGPDAINPPMPSPMSTPEPKQGQREAALVNVSMALDLIEQALPAVGSETPEGQALMKALGTLSGVLGPKKQKTGELQPAEILNLIQSLPGAGGGSPMSAALAGAPPMGAPGGAPSMPMPPGGAPPAGPGQPPM